MHFLCMQEHVLLIVKKCFGQSGSAWKIPLVMNIKCQEYYRPVIEELAHTLKNNNYCPSVNMSILNFNPAYTCAPVHMHACMHR